MTDDAAPPSVAELVEGLAHEDPVRRATAARALTKLGPAAGPALPALVDALEDPIFLVRAMAAAAIGRQGEAAAGEALDPLARLLEDPVAPVRFWAVDALGRMPQAAAYVLEALQRCVEDEDQGVRGAATRTVARVSAASRNDA